MKVKSSMHAVDQAKDLLRQQTQDLHLKSHGGRDVVEGYLATKGLDKVGDVFTDEALRDMAKQINEGAVEDINIHFPKFSEEDFEAMAEDDPNTGNVEHNNFQGFPFSDTRIVPAFKVIEAEFDGFGIKVKGVLNSDGLLPDTVDAIKNAIREGWLDAMSIEFKLEEAEVEFRDGDKVRKITNARAAGAALTGRPANPRARLTDADLKSMIDSKADIGEGEGSESEGEASKDEGDIEADQKEDKSMQGDSMTEEQDNEDVKNTEAENQESQGDSSELKGEVEEVKSAVQEVKEENEALREENDELKSKLEDYEKMESLESDISEIKEELKSFEPQKPQGDPEEQKFEEKDSNEDRLERELEAQGLEGSKAREDYVNKHIRALTSKYNMSTEEVKNHV